MRRIAYLIAAAALMIGTAPGVTIAKTSPKVAGMSCSAAVKKVGSANVWRTSFSGARERPTDLFGKYDYYSAAPCFTSQANCKAWLYNTQTAWPLFMDFVPCHRGLR